jgi:hypothetical protein
MATVVLTTRVARVQESENSADQTNVTPIRRDVI